MGKVAHIYLVGPVGIFEDSNGEQSGFTIDSVISQIQSYKGQEIERFNFKMKGPGGYVDEGNAIYDYMLSLRSDTTKISTEQIGDIGSIMTKLFLAPDEEKGEQRLVKKGAKFMIHNPWGGVEGDANDFKKYGEELEEIEKDLRNFYKDKTGITPEGLKPLMDKEAIMTSEQAIALGFATGYAEEKTQNKVLALVHKNQNRKTMNTTETKLDKILNFMKSLTEKKEEPKKNLELTLESGTSVRVDVENEEGIVGAEAYVVDADGNEQPAPEGEHILDDGRILVVNASGVVTEIREVEEPAEPAAKQKTQEELKAELEATKQKLKEFQESFEEKVEQAVEAKLAKATDRLESGMKEVQTQLNQFKAMKTLYKVKDDVDFVKELNDQNAETRYDEGKKLVEEKKSTKKKGFKRGAIASKVKVH